MPLRMAVSQTATRRSGSSKRPCAPTTSSKSGAAAAAGNTPRRTLRSRSDAASGRSPRDRYPLKRERVPSMVTASDASRRAISVRDTPAFAGNGMAKTENRIAQARKERKGRPAAMGERVVSRFESDFIPDLGPRSLDGARRQLEDPPGVPEDPGYSVPAEPFVPSHHLPVRTEKERVELKTHPERVDAAARVDPEPLPGRETVRPEKPLQPGEEAYPPPGRRRR